MKLAGLGQTLLAAAAAGTALWWASTARSSSGGMDSHRLPNIVEAALPPHHRSTVTWRHGKFDNPWATWEERSFRDVLRWNRERRKAGVPTDGYLEGNHTPSAADFAAAFPSHPVDLAALASPPADAVQATWVGHSTLLVQMEGLTFLTDPIFSERCSPVQWMGPKRVVSPALTVDQLPKVDAVLLSHNHYDHLDKGSVKQLNKRFGRELRWYVPLGLKGWFTSRGVHNVEEVDWWHEVQHPGSSVRVVFTPAQVQHWSMRSPWSRKASLWGGWAVLGEAQRFWFAGDTGYAPVFSEIGERLGPFDLAAIPIGAYEPRWFMKPQHTNPAEAVQIHRDVRALRSVAIHHATFSLTDEPLDEPAKLLPQEAQKAAVPADAFLALRHGAKLITTGGRSLNAPPLLPPPKGP